MLWKTGRITPVYKSGDNTDVKNYRPISVLNTCCKIFERIVHNNLFLQHSGIITKFQHGFYPKRSTLTNHLIFSESVYDSISNQNGVDVIYTDFSKAFDKVNHEIILRKLQHYGFDYLILKWIKSYLTQRTQYVQLLNEKSYSFSPLSGVPQGSILGPLLFLFFINDVVTVINSNVLLFADDLKLFRPIKSLNDCKLLQKDLDSLHGWCCANDLHFNIDKCCVLKIKPRPFHTQFIYSINNFNLQSMESVKDLGIIVDNGFKFNIHIDATVNRAFKLLGFVMRLCGNFKDPACFITIFNSLIRSILEYCSPIWNPHYKVHVDRIERDQKKFTRFLNYKLKQPYDSYSVRLHRFELMSLESRRIIFDEIVLFKIVNCLIECDNFVIRFRANVRYSIRNPLCFDISTVSTNIRLNSPCIRLQNMHNRFFNSINLLSFDLAGIKKIIRMSLNRNLN